MSGVPGVVEAHADFEVEVPQVDVEVNLAAARRYGIKPGDVRRAAATLVSGEEVADVFRGGKAYDVQVWSTPRTRRSLTSIEDLPIDTPGGRQVRLGDVATVRVKPAPNLIERDNNSRRSDVGAVARDVSTRLRQVSFPRGYDTKLLGEYQERQAAQRNLLLYAVAALIG